MLGIEIIKTEMLYIVYAEENRIITGRLQSCSTDVLPEGLPDSWGKGYAQSALSKQ